MDLPELLSQIRACSRCAAYLPLPPKPVVRAEATARLLIVGQAPSVRVHETGLSWNDASGKRLRAWLQIEKDVFYDQRQVAIVPMGFCYPGKGSSGDLPPRAECAPQWHDKLLACLPQIGLTLLVGQYAQKYYLGGKVQKNLTETVRAWRNYAPQYLPLPHPSPRNLLWFKRNPWFEEEVVPILRQRVGECLAS